MSQGIVDGRNVGRVDGAGVVGTGVVGSTDGCGTGTHVGSAVGVVGAGLVVGCAVGAGLIVGAELGVPVGTAVGAVSKIANFISFCTLFTVTFRFTVALVFTLLSFAIEAREEENDPLPVWLNALTNCDVSVDSRSDSSSPE